ncbi:hypothetical protein SAM23877_2223 [Streptomyces ambofaciens ATCC 23877]|uniref:DUF5304 domain-containing protein n=2 Tax=Streptomyces ambofaciens TaxID=1889 RepID=A0A0K2AR21_STRA7|nr:DUF5304 domain-containing protein [Streptomyces ambofaciens]AKZ55272.1 hypothetical protein SAM23877_2223 [Streptomyces ambofaciens ATCC 23877]ANB05985.1 hypothetical protein SAM40697_2025 [Streptomyces ambofaciens]
MSEELPKPEAARPDEADAVDEVRATDADAWATACAEDLKAEKARRRAEHGPQPGSAAEELRRLVDTVADKLSGLQSPLLGQVAGPAAQQVVRQVVQQAKAAVEPVIERNPGVFDHLAAAGGELLAAYRSAVQNQESRWTAGDTAAAGNTADTDPRDPRDLDERRADGRDDGDEGTGPGQRIDLD